MESLGMLKMRAGAAVSDPYQTASLRLGADARAKRPLENRHGEPRPIWLSALEATSCRARSRGRYHAIRWQHVSGRATYTNLGTEEECIEPLGVSVPRGKTVAVSWLPGETEYTVEVYNR
jgi:hypothetical protein